MEGGGGNCTAMPGKPDLISRGNGRLLRVKSFIKMLGGMEVVENRRAKA